MDSIPLSRHHDGKQGHGDAAADDPVMLRDKALLEFMYATGSRVSEACGVDLDDIDLDDKVARLMGKGSKQRLVPVGSFACELCADISDSDGPPCNPSPKEQPSTGRCSSTSAANDCPDSRCGKSSEPPVSVRTSPSRCIRIPCAIPSRRI